MSDLFIVAGVIIVALVAYAAGYRRGYRMATLRWGNRGLNEAEERLGWRPVPPYPNGLSTYPRRRNDTGGSA